jgi:hypothetical protein
VPVLAVVFFLTFLLSGLGSAMLAAFASWLGIAAWVLVGSYRWGMRREDLHGSTYDENRIAHSHTEFSAYKAAFVSEVKRLSGKTDADLHWVELTDDAGTQRAFQDGVEARALALIFHRQARPPM